MGFLLNFSLKSHLVFFFLTKNTSQLTDVPQRVAFHLTEKTVYIVFILLFLHMHNWLPDFQLETATFLPGIEIETATFLVESRNPRILAELVESLPLFFLESHQNPRIPETQNPVILVELVESLPLFFLESYQNPPLFFLESQQNPPLYFGIPGHMYAFDSLDMIMC